METTVKTQAVAYPRCESGYDLGRMTERLALLYGPREALVEGELRLSYAALGERVQRVARALARSGVGPGSRVATLLLDGVAMVELCLATARLGAIIVPLNWRLADRELAYILDDAAPRLLFVHERFQVLARAAAPECATIMVSESAPHHAAAYAEWVDASSDMPRPHGAHGESAWALLYTSGTTGTPKGCLLSQAGWMHLALNMGHRLGLTPADCFMLTAPLFHSAGMGQLLAHLVAGCLVLIAPRSASARELREAWQREGCTHVSPPPTLYDELFALQAQEPVPLKIRLFTMAASMNPPQLVKRVMEAFNTRTIHGFGQTEVSGFAAFLFGEEQVQRPTALGQPLLSVEAQVVDDAGRPLPPDTPGELVLRGPSVMLCYRGLPEATAATLAGGWLHTGDIVRIDQDGYWHFVSRKKELIKTLGENVYPAEVEQRLLSHPAVLECAVFGVPDAHYIEAVKAVIAVRPGHRLDAAEVSAWCRETLAGYKRPRYIEFLPELPRSPIGKVHVAALRERPTTPGQAAP